MTPAQVLECQAQFVERSRERNFATYLRGCYMTGVVTPRSGDTNMDEEIAKEFSDMTVRSFRYGETYLVTPEMTDLVVFAASKLDATDRYDRTLPPTSFGVVRFDRPLPVWDARGQRMEANWLSWAPCTFKESTAFGVQSLSAVFVTLWNDTLTHPDEVHSVLKRWAAKDAPAMIKIMGRWGFIGTDMLVDGRKMGGPEDSLTPEMLEFMMKEDERWKENGLSAAPKPAIGKHTNVGRYAHALWLLLNQTVTDVSEARIPRSAAKRVGLMPIPGKISVVQLRRSEHRRSEGETLVQWQHRWLVRGHWRWQPYKDGTVARIWINPYVKGPEGLPFAQTKKVYRLAR